MSACSSEEIVLFLCLKKVSDLVSISFINVESVERNQMYWPYILMILQYVSSRSLRHIVQAVDMTITSSALNYPSWCCQIEWNQIALSIHTSQGLQLYVPISLCDSSVPNTPHLVEDILLVELQKTAQNSTNWHSPRPYSHCFHNHCFLSLYQDLKRTVLWI